MAHIYISGLLNTETTVQVRDFPIPYYPIDYPFFGVWTMDAPTFTPESADFALRPF